MMRIICGWFGHCFVNDPGDVVLHCSRCHASVDLRALADSKPQPGEMRLDHSPDSSQWSDPPTVITPDKGKP